MPAMPAGLRPALDGFSTTGPGGVERTPVAGGMPRYALDFDRGLQPFSVTLPLTDLEFSVWSAFYHQVTKKGTIPFDMPLDSGRGTQTHSVQIVPGTYRVARAAGALSSVQFVVLAQSSIYAMTASEAQDLVDDFVADTGQPLVNLLRPTVAEYSFEGPEGAVQSEIAGGSTRIALDVDRSPQQFSVVLRKLSKAQYEVWAAYYHHIIAKGSVPFQMYLDSGFGPALHQVYMVPGTYRASRAGARTVVSFVVEAEGQCNDITPAEAQLLVDLFNTAGAESAALLARIAQFANEDTLVLAV